MSRMPATSAANLANDLDHALTVCEGQLADAVQQLEEANAVIDAVRKLRPEINSLSRGAYREWKRVGNLYDSGTSDAFDHVIALLDAVDGL